MEALLKWCGSIRLDVERQYSSDLTHVFFAERINYSSDFVEMPFPEEIIEQLKTLGTTVYTLFVDAIFIRGRASYETRWGFTPSPSRVRLGFAGIDKEELLERVTKWFIDNTDHEQEPAEIPYHSKAGKYQPIVMRTKNYPHYRDEVKDE